jgi:hypothetical protein
MIGYFRKPPVRDPQSGVPFRPAMLVHAGSLSHLAGHRITRLERAENAERRPLVPWTLAMAGLMGAFYLGTAWPAATQTQVGDLCLTSAPTPGAPPSK